MRYFDLMDHDRPDLCIADATRIADDVLLGSGVVIDDNVIIGKGSRVWHHTVIRFGVRIGENVTIGHNVVIEQNTTIGDNTTIQSQCHITAFAKIGRNVFIGPNTTLINDKRISSHGRHMTQDLVGPIIKDGARIGSHCLLMPRSTVGEQAFVGAGSILKGSVPDRMCHICRTREVILIPVPEEELLP